jgi:hypothetical protein
METLEYELNKCLAGRGVAVAQILGMTTDAHVVATLNPGLSMRTFDDAVVVARAQTSSPPIGMPRPGTHSGLSELPAMWSGPAMSTNQNALMARQAAESGAGYLGPVGPAASGSFPAQGIALRAQSSPSLIQPAVMPPGVWDPGLPAAPPIVVVHRSALGVLGWIVLAAVLFGGVGSLLYIALGERNAVRASEAAARAGGSARPAARDDADAPEVSPDPTAGPSAVVAPGVPGSPTSDPAPPRPDRDPAGPPEAAGSAAPTGPGSQADAGDPRKSTADDRNRRRTPPPRPAPGRRPVAATDDKDPKTAAALQRQAKAAEAANKWDEARGAYQRLEKFRQFRSEAMYGQAMAAFQMQDPHMAETLAGQLATEAGPFKTRSMFLYADALYQQAQYARAKVIYQKLRSELKGDQRSIAQRKIAACNKELGLPENSGID